MRNVTFVLALVAGLGVATGIVAAAPADQKRSEPTLTPNGDDVHVTVTAGRGRLGFGALQISPELRTFLGAPSDRGVLVDQLRADSPAARAGLRVGDVILEVDAAPARSVSDIVDAISDRKTGDVVAIEVARGRSRVSLKVKLDSDPGAPADALGSGTWQRFGEGALPLDLGRMFGGDPETRRELEATRKRLQQLEQRIEKLEHH